MPKKTVRPTPQQLAEDAATRYINALASDLPFDNAPGSMNLLEEASKIGDVIRARLARADEDDEGATEDAALRAGYLLGVAVGRRIGGVR